jgi:hypothetical protein
MVGRWGIVMVLSSGKCLWPDLHVCMYKTVALFHWMAWPLVVFLVWPIDPEDFDCSVCQNAGIASTNDVVKHWRLKSYNDVHLSSLHVTYLLYTNNEKKNRPSLSVWLLREIISEFGILFPVKSYSSIK